MDNALNNTVIPYNPNTSPFVSGYTCSFCGVWVSWNATHVCPKWVTLVNPPKPRTIEDRLQAIEDNQKGILETVRALKAKYLPD